MILHFFLLLGSGVENWTTESELEFHENGTAHVQNQTYYHATKEAILRVPAHKGYGKNSFITLV